MSSSVARGGSISPADDDAREAASSPRGRGKARAGSRPAGNRPEPAALGAIGPVAEPFEGADQVGRACTRTRAGSGRCTRRRSPGRRPALNSDFRPRTAGDLGALDVHLDQVDADLAESASRAVSPRTSGDLDDRLIPDLGDLVARLGDHPPEPGDVEPDLPATARRRPCGPRPSGRTRSAPRSGATGRRASATRRRRSTSRPIAGGRQRERADVCGRGRGTQSPGRVNTGRYVRSGPRSAGTLR